MVKGKLQALLDLLEGRSDSDAMFFRRDIVIGGDTSVVETLRNALDRDPLDLFEDVTSIFGSFAALARRAIVAINRAAGGENAGELQECRRGPGAWRRNAAPCARRSIPSQGAPGQARSPAREERRGRGVSASPAYLELVCPAGTPTALRAAVDAGAHAVYCGFRDETNARNYPGLNFDAAELEDGIAYAHEMAQGPHGDQHLSPRREPEIVA